MTTLGEDLALPCRKRQATKLLPPMEPEPRILEPKDFGAFEPELKRAFREAFHFAWDVGPETVEEQGRRRAFAKVISAARAEPRVVPARCDEFLQKIHDLEFELCDYLWPGERLRDDLGSVAAAASGIGDKLSRLTAAAFAQEGGNTLPSVAGIRSGWRELETKLRAAREAIPLTSPSAEIMRLRKVGAATLFKVRVVTALLGTISPTTKHAVKRAASVKDLKGITDSLRDVARTLEAFDKRCTPPHPDEAPFRAYFERVVESLPIRCSVVAVDALEPEVPSAVLKKQRERPARRAAVLEWLCTTNPEFYPLLPSAARRDHRPPAISGGKGQRNWALHGLAAALVLLGLVDAARGSRNSTGKRLFEATVKRVERWIAEQAATGHFYVDTTNTGEAPTRSTGMALVDRYLMKGGI